MMEWKECECALPAGLGELRVGETKAYNGTSYHRQPKTGKVFMYGPPCGCKDAHAGVGAGHPTSLGPRGAWSPYKGSLPTGLDLKKGAEPRRFGAHWWYRQKKSGRVMTIGVGDDPSDCDATEVFDPNTQTCVKVAPIHEACAPGYSWTQENGCVKDSPKPPPAPPPVPIQPTCAPDETYNAATQRCEKTQPAAPASSSSSATGWIIGGLAAAGVVAVGAALLMKPKSTAIRKAADANMREAAVYEGRAKALHAAAKKREREERAA